MLKDSKDHENLLKEYEMIKEENKFLNCEISMAEEQIRELEKVLQMVIGFIKFSLSSYFRGNFRKITEFSSICVVFEEHRHFDNYFIFSIVFPTFIC